MVFHAAGVDNGRLWVGDLPVDRLLFVLFHDFTPGVILPRQDPFMQCVEKPPSDEGGGFCEAKDGGRDRKECAFGVSLPQSASLTAPSSEGGGGCLLNRTAPLCGAVFLYKENHAIVAWFQKA